MDLLTNLPEDLIIVIVGTLYRTSKVSVIVFAHISKSCYEISKKCAIQNKINRSLHCHEIAAEGSLEVLKWARSNGCDRDSYTCAYAAGNGHLEILKWARSSGCEWNSLTCAWAAQNGHLEVLKWARSNGCCWDSETENLAKQKWPNVFS